MEPTTVQIIHDAIQRNASLSIALKNGLTKIGKPLHFINDKFLIIQTHSGNFRHDLILVEDIHEVSFR